MNTDSIDSQMKAMGLGDLATWQNWIAQNTEGLPEALSTVSDLLGSNSNVALVILGGLFASLLIFFRAASVMTSGEGNYQPSDRNANSELLFTTAYKPRLDGTEDERHDLGIVLSSQGGEIFGADYEQELDLDEEDELGESDNLILMKKRFQENRKKKKTSKAA